MTFKFSVKLEGEGETLFFPISEGFVIGNL